MRQDHGGLTSVEAELINRLVDKLDQISVDVAEIKVKIDGLVENTAGIGTRLEDADSQIQDLKNNVTGIKTVGATLVTLWGVIVAGIGIYLRLK